MTAYDATDVAFGRALVDALGRYEDEHPKGALCLTRALAEARAQVAWHYSAEVRRD